MKNKTILMTFLAILTMGLLIACTPEEAEYATETTETATETALDEMEMPDMTAEIWVDDPTLGSALNEEGRVAFGAGDNDFEVGDTIYYAMEIGDAPAGASVRVVWYGADDAQVHEETQQVQAGQDYMHFQAPDTSAWTPGDYRVEVYANEQLAHEEDFNIEEAE